ncbi:MarR family transcriptional regulator [Petrotoga sp. 9PW.55.5.1]|jgi:DNA-binding MarR family transcriptional regulator|uniref:MarR family winged helix-turn-helix transcriptional regulator n=1 Tax=Petrotoga sp. 9PW.55.5.1 TaxID=1308979 RepID=UPI000DC49144|nr:MarR family transcriptional regulator [Petrotoga sp. 9PW.55.5.1]RAP00052.1 MarR family transcriptional regulator [Petrotoga sp. 9PW.55.5.1]
MEENPSVEMEKLIREICSKVKSEGRKVLKEVNISPAQFDVLQTVYFKGPKMLSEISKRLGITKSTTTGLIRRLELAGYLVREKSKKDKRVFVVAITPQGVTIIEKVIKNRIALMEQVYKKMGNKEKSIEILNEINKILHQNQGGI